MNETGVPNPLNTSEDLLVVIMEVGISIVSDYFASVPKIIQSGATGWHKPANDANALYRILLQALEAPIAAFLEMKERSKEAAPASTMY